jgi:hypothetical protein
MEYILLAINKFIFLFFHYSVSHLTSIRPTLRNSKANLTPNNHRHQLN